MADEVAALGHNFGEWVVTKEPTEATKGEKRRDCANCDHFETDVVAELAHDHSRWEQTTLTAVAPTCTTTGLTEGKKCSGCGETLVVQQSVPAMGHDYNAVVTAPTCTAKGYTTYTCDCGDSYVADEVAALGHTEVVDVAISATCTTTGLTEGKHCSVCDTVIIAQSTVAAKGHTEVIDQAVAPTCTETGLTEGKHCSECNTVLKAQETVFTLNHEISHHNALEPTCTEAGWNTYDSCLNCDYTTYSAILALGHNFINRECTRCKELEPSDILEYKSNGDGTCYVSGTENRAEPYIIIPRFSPSGDKVIGIGSSAFSYYIRLENIVIPETVTYIENSAFYNCSALKSITLPSSLTRIGNNAFTNCLGLTTIVIPNSVLSIGVGAFEGCSNLEKLTLPFIGETRSADLNFNLGFLFGWLNDNATEVPLSLKTVIVTDAHTIGYGAFSDCSGIENIIISNTVTTIQEEAFKNCTALKNLSLGNGVVNIARAAFDGCNNLNYTYFDNAKYLGNDMNPHLVLVAATNTEISSCQINSNTKIIFELAFSNCTKLQSVSLPTGIVTIGTRALQNCSSIKSITIPGSVLIIGVNAFSGCTNLESVIINDGVTTIGGGAFYFCTKLKTVILPSSVESIEGRAFDYTNLNTIYYVGSLNDWNTKVEINADNSYFNSATVYYYSKTQPTVSGNYWHYINGIPTKW